MMRASDLQADRDRLVAYLRDHPGESTCDRLASNMSWTRSRTAGVLRSLQRTGHVGYDAESCYWQHGRDRLAASVRSPPRGIIES